MPKMTEAEKKEQELEEFLGSTKSRSSFFTFADGKTGFFPVYEQGTSPVSAFGKTMTYYDGEGRDRWVIYALVAMAEDRESLPDGYENKLFPVFIPKTLAHSIAKKLKSDQFNDGCDFTSISEDGKLTIGDMFVVERTTDKKRTSYEVSIASKKPPGLVTSVDVPELSIQEFAIKSKEQAEIRNAEWLADNSNPAGSDTPKTAANDFAGFA